ncbi:unnamed protein product [Rhizophagus irregularis]|nr:unnamed protein product [Rhizophagus irregularis]CAB5392103.1 unnamed protein product [Rhizophagus irregularis]
MAYARESGNCKREQLPVLSSHIRLIRTIGPSIFLGVGPLYCQMKFSSSHVVRTLMASEVFLSDSGIFSGIRVINNSQSDRVDLPSHTTTLDK